MGHGMNKYKLSLITSSLLLAQALPAYANNVDADSLIGKYYGGIHAAYLNADNDRIDDEENDFNKGTGLGLEAGYRFTAPLEFRLSYSLFKSEDSDPDNVNKVSLDTLYFPTEKSIYLLGGISSLDLDSSWDASVNAGVGYRHYFSLKILKQIRLLKLVLLISLVRIQKHLLSNLSLHLQKSLHLNKQLLMNQLKQLKSLLKRQLKLWNLFLLIMTTTELKIV